MVVSGGKVCHLLYPIKTTDHECDTTAGRTWTSRRFKLQHLEVQIVWHFFCTTKICHSKTRKDNVSVGRVIRDGAVCWICTVICVCFYVFPVMRQPNHTLRYFAFIWVTQNNLCQHARVSMIATAQGKLDVACLKDNISSGLVLSRKASVELND